MTGCSLVTVASAAMISSASRAPSLRALGRGLDAQHEGFAGDLLEQDARLGACRRADALVEDRLDVARADPGADAHLDVDGVGLAEWNDRGREDDAVGDHHPVLPARERRVQEAERADDAFGPARQWACLEPYSFADPERACAQEHHPGDQVSERLLRGETQHDRGERAAERERLRVQSSDSQGGEAA